MKKVLNWFGREKPVWFWAVLGVILLLLALGLFFFGVKKTPSLVFDDSGIVGCKDLNRNAYRIPSAVFEELPKPPKCFSSIVERYHAQQFSDDFFFTHPFFSQPEFYPSFARDGLLYWTNPITTHWGAIGFGAFPSEQKVLIQPGQTVKTRFFFHSGFGVRTFQGLRLEPLFENPSAKEWMVIELDSESQNGFVLGPSFPKFDANWVKPVDVQITLLPNAPVQQMSFFLVTQSPSAEKAEQWSTRYPNYYNGTSFVGSQNAVRVRLEIT